MSRNTHSSTNSDNSMSSRSSRSTDSGSKNSYIDIGSVANRSDLNDFVAQTAYYKYDSECLRKKSNWSKTRSEYKFDHPDFNPKQLKNAIHTHSSKLESLLNRIEYLDKRDMDKDGRKYKHFIFSDIKTGLYGAKLIAGALLAKGMHLGYGATPLEKPTKTKTYNKIILDGDDELMQTKYNNFYLLSSIAVYDQPISVAMKKSILQKFNSRPDNIYGELARIIVMDSGYKEGIDLFDIKYVHIYEPQTTMADQKQVIGRGTRTCGQKGLSFHPTKGWPLHVFIYDVEIPQELRAQMLGSPTLFDLYMKSMNIDFRLFNFQHDLERATVYGSVDYELNRDIHNFAIAPDEEDMMFGGAKKKIVIDRKMPKLILGFPLNGPMTFQQNREFVRKYYSQYAWKDVKMENNCASKKGGADLITYTPTQDFIRNYFTPMNPVKGMLLWQSVGTGKTCSAIAAATSSFEKEGYTILWVTRTTLKNDIWKNMFDQVCNESIRDKLKMECFKMPDEQAKRMRLLSDAWSIRPMSYKQFSNLVSRQNNFYDALVKKNGESDPLRKTLLIIDEAHKLYGGEDLSSIERPDMNALNAALQNSYMVSGKDSVRLLLMTATPITGNPMELIKLINLLKPMDKQMPDEFSEFSNTYLNEDGRFDEAGEKQYLDDIAGYVSYLNREKDARQFSQPIVRFINVPLVKDIKEVAKLDKALFREQVMGEITGLQKQIEENNDKIDSELKGANALKFGFLKQKCSHLEGKAKKACEKIVKTHITQIVKDVKEGIQGIKDNIKDLKTAIVNKKQYKQSILEAMKMDTSEETARKMEELKNSMYYTITHQCGKKITDSNKIESVIKDIPDIVEINNQMKILDEQIDKLKQNLEIAVVAHKNRLKHIKEMMRGDITSDEKNLLKSILKDESKKGTKNIHTLENAINQETKEIEKVKRATLKIKKRTIRNIKKSIKIAIRDKKEEAKEIARLEKEEEKIRQKQGVYLNEIKNTYVKDIVAKHEDMIDADIIDMNGEFEKLESERLAKEAVKAEKAQIAATKKQQKILEMEHKKTMKLQKMAEKSREKNNREHVKEMQKRAKDQERNEKQAEKDRMKAEKAQIAATKKLQPNQKRNKTAKLNYTDRTEK